MIYGVSYYNFKGELKRILNSHPHYTLKLYNNKKKLKKKKKSPPIFHHHSKLSLHPHNKEKKIQNYAILACIATLQDSMEQKVKEKDYRKRKRKKHHFHPWKLKASRWIVISQINEHVCISCRVIVRPRVIRGINSLSLNSRGNSISVPSRIEADEPHRQWRSLSKVSDIGRPPVYRRISFSSRLYKPPTPPVRSGIFVFLCIINWSRCLDSW